MGVLSIFSRKPERESGQLIKTQAYNTTSASSPPVRGTYPVAGNGPNVLENLSKSQSRLGQSQVSLNHYDSAAPAPIVPRYLEEGYGRPSSAPNGNHLAAPRPGFLDRAKKEWSRGMPSSGRQSKSNSPAPGPRRKTLDAKDYEQVLRTLPAPANPPYTQNRRDSLKSNGGKTFVDILDAQSEIRPANFRSRIHATGARDYGEDVADRNIPKEEFDSETNSLQAFHTLSTHHDHSHQPIRGDPPRLSSKDLRNNSRLTPAKQHGSLESGLRTKSLNSSSHYTFPKRSSSHIPPSLPLRDALPPVPDLNTSTRSSKHGLRLDTQNIQNRIATANTSRGRTRARSLHSDLVFENVTRPEKPSSQDQQPPVPGIPSHIMAKRGLVVDTNVRTPLPPQASISTANKSFKPAQDSSIASKKEKRTSIPTHSREGSAPEHRRTLSSEVHTLREVSEAINTSPSKLHIARRNLHTRQSSIASSVASRETGTDSTALAYRTHEGEERDGETGRLDALSFEGFVRDTVPSRPSSSSGWHSPATIREDLYGYQRSRSLMSSAGKPRLSEIYEYVPLRTSSLRHWSMSSASGTASETSSNPFPRPTSRHTANTSLDLSPGQQFSSADSASSANSVVVGGRVRSPKLNTSDEINLDDYLSSDDDDAYTPPRQPRGVGEEGLLFRDGYGLGGMALPGLMDPVDDAAPPPVLDNRNERNNRVLPHQRSNPSLPSGTLRKFQGNNPASPPSKTRRYIVDTKADFDDFSDGGYEEEIPSVLRRSTKRLSALSPVRGAPVGYSTAEDVIEEEQEEKVDVNTAVKLRKEAKARKRAAAMEQRKKSKGKGKGKEKENEMERIEALTRAHGLA